MMTTETKYYRVTLLATVEVDYETDDASTPEEAKAQALNWAEAYWENLGVEPCSIDVEDIEERKETEDKEGFEWI